MLSQVGVADSVVGEDFGGRSRRNHMPFAHDVGTLANIQRLSHVMVGNEHPDISLFKVRDDGFNVGY